jgi:DNA end-binding protein Ku
MATLWRGFLRLSLVSCPVAVTPATTERSRISFNQLNRKTGNRVRQKLVDEQTGEDVERDDIVKGYQIEKGRYVVIDDEKLKELQIESSKIIDLETFVDADEIDGLYLDKPYYLVPDGPIGTDTFRVIAQALKDKGKIAVGRVVISSREHMVVIQPHDGTLLMTTMRAANEVRAPEFRDAGGELNDEAVSLAGMIIDKRAGKFDPSAIQDRYQDALRNLVEETAKGHDIVTPQIAAPAQVIDLMAALKRSLVEAPKSAQQSRAAKGKKKVADARQRNLMLPVKGGKAEGQASREESPRAKTRKRA